MESITLPLWLYPLLLLTGFAAGFVDSVAGGGGLMTLPVLLNLGLPPQVALGTNKLQATFGSGTATWHYGRAGLIDFRACWLGVLCTLIGATAGTLLVSQVSSEGLKQLIPWLLLAIAAYVLFQPRLGESDLRGRMGPHPFHLLFGFVIGFYDGFFGPGTGTFWAMAYMMFLGFNMTRATAHTKVMNFTSNAASLAVFMAGGQVHVPAGICMGVGQVLGARLGSRVVIRKGTRLIRPIFITAVIAVTGRLLWENFAK